MAEGETSSAMRDVERATTPLITQIPKITLSNKDIEEVRKRFHDVIDTITVDNTSAKLEEFEGILDDVKIKEMEASYKQEEKNLQNVLAHLPGQKSFLIRFSLQEILLRMLKDIAKYDEFLKLFIDRFKTHKERIEGLLKMDTETAKTKKHRRSIIYKDPRTMRELDTPLHCAVRQLNEDFIEWLLEQPETEVNLRNKRRETALAILCQMYDSCKEHVPKLKIRIEKADKMQQMRLDNETIEVSAQIEELEEEMNASTILKLIKRLLEKGADFNVYMNDGALPFDFLRKYDTEADVAEIINSYTKSNVAMTEKPPKPLNASAEGKNVSKKRIVKFYKKTEDMDVRVTVELLEIFIWFQDLEKLKHYWKDFKVTDDNVKKVITQLLHVAVELNYTTFVDHIIKKASKEIFKTEENKVKQNKTIEPQDNIPDSYRNRAETTPMSAKVLSRWRCFKCCQKRYYPGSQTQSEGITSDSQDKCVRCFKCWQKRRYPNSQTHAEEFELRALDSQDKCEFTQNLSSSEGLQTHDETFKLEKNEIGNFQDPCAGTSKRIFMNTGVSCKDNHSATEGAEPQTESGTSKLPATDPPVSQDTTAATPTNDEQPSGWCCLKCFQKKQNPPLPDGTNPQALNSKDCRLSKAEECKMVHRTELKGLLKMVCLNGNITLLNMFLKIMDDRLLVNENPLLINTLNLAYRMKQKKESTSLLECMKILINNHRKVDMYCVDKNGNTALHLALRFGYDKTALLMLKKIHGLIGFRNRLNKTPIEYGTTEFWNTYLDSYISTNNDESELRFNVCFLDRMAKKESTYVKRRKAVKVTSFKHVKPVAQMSETHNSKYRFTRTVNDMTALRLISQSKDRKEFLMHPVIIAFITMKWMRLSHWHILNLLLTTFTMGTFICYTLLPCPSGGWKFGVMAFIGAFIILVREFMQFYLLGWSYITLENIVDLMLLKLLGIILFCGCERDGLCKYVPTFSSWIFVSLSIQAIFLLSATWNNLYIMFYMFQTVSSSFLKSFLSFCPVIVAFVCSFYQIYNETSSISISNGTESSSSEKNFNNFRSVWDATIKTLVMTTGEFEAANMDINDDRWLLFVTFLFIAPLIMMNLINGLAVSDIADIRKESEFICAYNKVRMLERYERAIVESRFTMSGCLQWLFRDPFLPSPFFEKYESIIYVNVNEKNKLAIKSKTKDKSTKEVIPSFPWLPKFSLKHYIGIRSFQLVLYMSLDQLYVDKAKTIVRRYRLTKNNSGLGTSELADTEQTERLTLAYKTAMNQCKTSTLSSPSVPDLRDKQIEMLQEQVRSLIAMLNNMQKKISGINSSKTE